MIVKTYGIYDSVQQEYVRTFNASNDDDARRAVDYIVSEKNFDDNSGKDRTINFLYSFDSSTGAITDNSVHLVCNFASAIEKRKSVEMETIVRQKLMTEEFVSEVKEMIKNTLKGELVHERNNVEKA